MSNTDAIRWAVARREGWECHYCGCLLGSTSATLEHVVPRAWGGQTDSRNTVLACRRCNGTRGSELVVCPCPFCIAARLHWFSHHAPRSARQAVLEGFLNLRGGDGPYWLPEGA